MTQRALEQDKWLHAGLMGFSAAFFLALFSAQGGVEESIMLHLSVLLFSIALPLFTIFTILCMSLMNPNLPKGMFDTLQNSRWLFYARALSYASIYLAVMFLIGHFTLLAMFTFFIISAAIWWKLRGLILPDLERLQQEKQDSGIKTSPVAQAVRQAIDER
ncbi:hypothetical protein [Photobacterium profundum]|nr:hypothetical protein [Photobacterium profundum]